MRCRSWFLALALAGASLLAAAADFGTPGGPPPGNVDAVAAVLRADRYDLELLISFGTSKGGSAGHLALAIREPQADDDLVYSANFYADRDPAHAQDRYTDELMVRIPKKEYLFGTASSVSAKASFGLDFGEVYKRSIIGVRVYGVPAAEKQALAAYFARINDDFRARARNTEYHHGEVRYDYLRLNCAKTIASAFKYGAGYDALDIDGVGLLSVVRLAAALSANIPTEMALKLMQQWHARGYGLDVVVYRKFPGSTWVDPLEEEKIAFKDLPDRFPSVLSRDFRRDAGDYQDVDNLYAMYLLHNLGRYGVRLNEQTKQLEIARRKEPLPYAEAAARAERSARADSASYGRQASFQPEGTRVGEDAGPEPR
jgi:hypothetical protein